MKSDSQSVVQSQMGRRGFLRSVGGAVALASIGGLLTTGCDPDPQDGFGLTLTESNNTGRLRYFRFATDEIGWNPGVNVIVPHGYSVTAPKRYPVIYWLHGGAQDFRSFDADLLAVTEGREVIVVMPDGGTAGWYSNPVNSFTGPRNWESFHINQLIPWMDANFRTYAEYDGRAVSGFSMGGFGALKYAAKYYGHFASVSSHSGPASLRRDGGIVVHWANTSSAAAELGGGTIYGAPFWDQARVSADNPCERIDSYHNKRIFLACGLGDDVNETPVRAGQREFRGLLTDAGIAHEWYELDGTHFVRREMLQMDVDGAIARLLKP